jgi:hypothetical protein
MGEIMEEKKKRGKEENSDGVWLYLPVWKVSGSEMGLGQGLIPRFLCL